MQHNLSDHNGVFGLDQLRWLAAGWMGGAFCVASYVYGHHSVWITDAWRVLQAICLASRDKLDQHDDTDMR